MIIFYVIAGYFTVSLLWILAGIISMKILITEEMLERMSHGRSIWWSELLIGNSNENIPFDNECNYKRTILRAMYNTLLVAVFLPIVLAMIAFVFILYLPDKIRACSIYTRACDAIAGFVYKKHNRVRVISESKTYRSSPEVSIVDAQYNEAYDEAFNQTHETYTTIEYD